MATFGERGGKWRDRAPSDVLVINKQPEPMTNPLLTEVDLVPLPIPKLAALIEAATADPDPAHMYMQLYYCLQVLGQHAFSLEMQRAALGIRRVYRTWEPARPVVRLLALLTEGDARTNAPLEYVVHGSDIRLEHLYLLPGEPLPESLPDHDVAIVAIHESDGNRALLDELDGLLVDWPCPVLNRPRNIARCARDRICQLLQGVPGLIVPETRRLSPAQGGSIRYPAIIRPIDAHSGKNLARLSTAADLAAYLNEHRDNEFHVADYVDYRSADGLFRKFRIALIAGQPYLCHLAISSDWAVHYRTAGMDLDAAKRAEEARAMANFADDFLVRHGAALHDIASQLGLEYVVLDCGESPDGRLVLFEADIAGWIHATDPADIYPYKPASMQKAFAAFRTLLLDAVRSRGLIPG